MEERAKQTKTEVNVYKWFGNVKRMSLNGLPRRIFKWERVGRGRKQENN
jgi:hypothetical protein